jgi:poly(A) polymerase
LLARGVAPGRQLGKALRAFEALWIRTGFPNEPETLTRLLEEAVVESMWAEPSAQETPEPRSS